MLITSEKDHYFTRERPETYSVELFFTFADCYLKNVDFTTGDSEVDENCLNIDHFKVDGNKHSALEKCRKDCEETMACSAFTMATWWPLIAAWFGGGIL